jgi:hypothetical protein
MVAGVGAPLEVLQCVEQGVDLINSAYPTMATELGQALNFSFLGVSAAAAEGALLLGPLLASQSVANGGEISPRTVGLPSKCTAQVGSKSRWGGPTWRTRSR